MKFCRSLLMLNKTLFICLIILPAVFTIACSPVIKNKPLQISGLASQHKTKHPDSIKVAVRTVFAPGSEAVHQKRANIIAHETATLLNKRMDSNVEFFPVNRFENIDDINYDFLLNLECKRPGHETEKNTFLFMLGWPATLSIVAAPLGLMVLSIPGIIKETADFNWTLSILPKNNDSLQLEQKSLPPLTSAVSATAWGTDEKILEESYINTESHLKIAAVDFVNTLSFDKLQKKAGLYARNQPSPSHANIDSDFPLSGRKIALIVGISDYKYSGKDGFSNLAFADKDAKAVYDLLKEKNWSTDCLKLVINKDATKRNIEIATESWLSKAGKDDIIFFFWAGHGYPDPDDPEKVYFACYDTDLNIPSTGLRMDRVRNYLKERNARNVILIADTCHAGKLITRGQNNRGLAVVPYINKLKRENTIPKGWVFFVGAESDRQAVEHSSWQNGAFTYCFLKALSGAADGYENSGKKDKQISLGELKVFMDHQMPDETLRVLGVAKHPIITTSTGDPKIWDLKLTE